MPKTDDFEVIEVPKGQFFSWASKPGQVVTGVVTAYGDEAGTDANGNIVPQISLELLADAVSVNKDGDRTEIEAGSEVTLNTGQANLKKGIKKAQPRPGDKVRMSFVSTEKNANGTTKIFEVAIKRAAPVAAAPAQEESEPPF